ncbi:unnamed protein product [Urochloa humidicola]
MLWIRRSGWPRGALTGADAASCPSASYLQTADTPADDGAAECSSTEAVKFRSFGSPVKSPGEGENQLGEKQLSPASMQFSGWQRSRRSKGSCSSQRPNSRPVPMLRWSDYRLVD